MEVGGHAGIGSVGVSFDLQLSKLWYGFSDKHVAQDKRVDIAEGTSDFLWRAVFVGLVLLSFHVFGTIPTDVVLASLTRQDVCK